MRFFKHRPWAILLLLVLILVIPVLRDYSTRCKLDRLLTSIPSTLEQIPLSEGYQRHFNRFDRPRFILDELLKDATIGSYQTQANYVLIQVISGDSAIWSELKISKSQWRSEIENLIGDLEAGGPLDEDHRKKLEFVQRTFHEGSLSQQPAETEGKF